MGELLSTVVTYDLRSESFRTYPAPSGGSATTAGWFPDGRRFMATADGAAWIVDADTGAWKELPVRLRSGSARLTADGRTLHYVETTTEADIWVARLE